jgi:hypothetical protein
LKKKINRSGGCERQEEQFGREACRNQNEMFSKAMGSHALGK